MYLAVELGNIDLNPVLKGAIANSYSQLGQGLVGVAVYGLIGPDLFKRFVNDAFWCDPTRIPEELKVV